MISSFPQRPSPDATTVDPQEIGHFAKDSAQWWDEHGPFKPLHMLNPVRLRYIRDRIAAHYGKDTQSLSPLSGLRLLDIGCGGGLVAESLARMGGTVTAVDADAHAITVAQEHAALSGLTIDYRAMSAEALIPTDKDGFDVVLALEIVEHVADRALFIESCAALCKPGGLVIMSTLNRTLKSLALGVVTAEYILRWVPQGTHDWRKFVKPSALSQDMRHAGLLPFDSCGYRYAPLTGLFELAPADLSMNYFMTARK